MINMNWIGDEHHVDDIDPGKDIFALLFLSFFLINAVVLLCVSNQSHQSIQVKSNTKTSSGKTINTDMLAIVSNCNSKICITQKNRQFVLPDDINIMKKHALFEIHKDKKGKELSTLIIRDPGNTISAGQLLTLVQQLNDANLSVDFRAIE